MSKFDETSDWEKGFSYSPEEDVGHESSTPKECGCPTCIENKKRIRETGDAMEILQGLYKDDPRYDKAVQFATDLMLDMRNYSTDWTNGIVEGALVATEGFVAFSTGLLFEFSERTFGWYCRYKQDEWDVFGYKIKWPENFPEPTERIRRELCRTLNQIWLSYSLLVAGKKIAERTMDEETREATEKKEWVNVVRAMEDSTHRAASVFAVQYMDEFHPDIAQANYIRAFEEYGVDVADVLGEAVQNPWKGTGQAQSANG